MILGTIMILATQASLKQSEGGEFSLAEFKFCHPAGPSSLVNNSPSERFPWS